MSAYERYLENVQGILSRIRDTQGPAIRKAAEAMARAIGKDRAVFLFGSGHSVLPVLDVFPRYGAYAGFYPLTDPRLMWWTPVGPGGARELLWLEREEGYVDNFLKSHPLSGDDVMVVFSHGGLNAAPVEMALAGKNRGATVVAITSAANLAVNRATHSSGKRLADVADVVIDNCTPPEDAGVRVEGWPYPVGAASTVAFVTIAQSLVSETAALLAAAGVRRRVFVSPNVKGVDPSNNARLFEEWESWAQGLRKR